MADGNWQRVRKIFDEALRQKPEERQNFVRQACGKNKTLQAEVESLLASLESADNFMETPAVARVAVEIRPKQSQFSSGRVLGHYEIIRPLGSGGMGEVYLANDTKLNRKVQTQTINYVAFGETEGDKVERIKTVIEQVREIIKIVGKTELQSRLGECPETCQWNPQLGMCCCA